MYSPENNININIKHNNEESNIYKLVDLITSIQKKISNLSKNMEHTKKNELFQKLSLIEDEILKNKKKINKYISKQKQNEINFKKMKVDNELLINKIDYELEEINKRINNIVSGGKNNDKEIYKISNDKINKIISQKKNKDGLRDLNIDYNSIIVIYQNLLNVLEVNINKRYQLNEKLKMLQEEKDITEKKVIEYISKKESLEEISKIYLLKFFNEIIYINLDNIRKISDEKINEEYKNENNNIIRNNSNHNNNNTFEPSNGAHSLLLNNKKMNLNNNYNLNISNDYLNIYLYELYNIDINNLATEIAIQLILSINSCLKSIYLNNKSLSNSLLQNNNKDQDNINNINNINNMQTKSNIIYNSKDNNSLISIISSKIKKEILTFMNYTSNNKNEKSQFQKLLDEFFINLSKNIINYLHYYFNSQLIIKSNQDNTSDFPGNILLLSSYFKLIFKKFYLDKIIQNECHFLNNEYKNIEKNIKSFLELAIANIKKLNNKKQEYDNKLNEIKQKKQLLQEKFINDKVHISMKDKAYFDLTKKTNELIDTKNKINDEFNIIQNNYNQENENIYKQILNKEKNLKQLEDEKNKIEDKIAKKNKIIMNEIDNLKKLMAEKFKLIKMQIEIYKKKYGNNFDLYDRLIEKINKSLRLTSKSLMHKNNILLNRTFSYNFYTPKNPTLSKNMINNTFYKYNNNNNSNNEFNSNTIRVIKNYRPFSKDAMYNHNKYNSSKKKK